MERPLFDFASFVSHLKNISFIDIIDILLVAALVYVIYAFIRDRRAGKLAVGIVILAVIMLISNLIGLKTMSFIMANCFQVGLIALVVVFQPELRSALEKMGGEPLRGLKTISDTRNRENREISNAIDEICQACDIMSDTKTGALIVFERNTVLDDIAHGGSVVNADISATMVRSIFYEGAPLHDGAVIVRNWKIYRAGTRLPLSENDRAVGFLGTRHHAALGITEESDAIAIVVSEETGIISLASGGRIKRRLTAETLKNELNTAFETARKVKKTGVQAHE